MQQWQLYDISTGSANNCERVCQALVVIEKSMKLPLP
jgi:hypothetical protein